MVDHMVKNTAKDMINSMVKNMVKNMVNPFRTAVSFWGQSTQISSRLSPNRDCGSKRVKNMVDNIIHH